MRNSQRGGVVSFVVVALALTGLLVGGLYLSKNQARMARETNTSTPQTTPKETSGESTQKPAENTTKPDGSVAGNNTNQQQNTPTPTPAQTPTPVASTGPQTPLPETGPSEVLVATLGLTALTFAGIRAYQARRQLHRSALRR